MKRIILLLNVFFIGFQFVVAQNVVVTGTITFKDDGLPVIGASVSEKGTVNRSITGVDGKYSISVPEGATLEFTYLGMESQSRRVAGSGPLNIVLTEDVYTLGEVVVTAMGVKTEKRKLNFAVQSINADDLTDKKASNFVNALQGKIAGLSVTTASGSPNAGSQVLIRGISSINNSQNNEPLFVMDGVPISGNGSTAADINPNDIESVTILKGAAAAALYGQDAANGVIMITTKRGQVGKMTATANVSWQYDVPTRLQKIQTSYAPGSQGFYKEKTMGGWGPLLNEGEQIYDNVNNFLTKGFYQKYDFSLTGGSEKFQTYASANYSKNDGIVPNDYLNKLGILLKGTYQPFKELSFTISANITENTYRGFSATGMSSVYNWPINDDISNYELINGYPRFLYYSDANKYNSPISPLYSRYNDDGKNTKLRNILSGSMDWNPVKNLNIIGRLSYDTSSYNYDGYSVPRWDDSVVYPNMTRPDAPGENATAADLAQYEKNLLAYNVFIDKYNNTPYLTEQDIEDMDKDALGAYSASNSRSQLFTASALATYKLELPHEFSVDFLAGAEIKMSQGFSMGNSGRDFIIPGTYSLSNTNSKYVYLSDRTATHSQKRVFGYFGEIRGDYKGLASLSVTSRWDWSSTILTNPYYYPSITGGILFSELFELKNNVFSYGKLRGNYAVVGKDAPAFLYDRRYKQFATYPDNGYGIDPTLSSADRNLQPEMTSSWEIGADLRFFNSRTRLDMAYYSTQVDNQIVTVRVSPSSGYILQTRNEGNIRNHGVEFTLEQDILKNRAFSWTAALNFGLNRSKVLGLSTEASETTGTQYGDIFTAAYVGESTTSLSGKTYARTEDGKIICGEDGYPQVDTNKNNYIGNREPTFLSGLSNTLNYKDWTLSFLFDGRLGGDVVNVTGRGLISNGQNKILETYRGRQIVFDGVVQQADGSYAPNTTPITLNYKTINDYFFGVSSNFVEDGSFIRLSYVALGYSVPQKLVHKIGLTGLRCSFTGNNLFMLTRYTGADPNCNASTSAGGTGSAGIDNYAVPNTTGYNFSITATF
ncbi:MAG: SusC/RagA family TonB-linked outer membrane protein [Dysgonamonadaceae bacterium]|jgi:TonB-linked SusC/RagA family outer membrane protein|nr:SusC/RagA family TonB-linked outer membrane protein [Dysgonamonadaceae bacterium]